MFHLGWFLGTGFGIQPWNSRGTATPGAGFDYILIEDTSMIEDSYGDSMEMTLQRRPVIAQAGNSAPGRDLAARNADAMLAHCNSVEEMTELRVRSTAAPSARSSTGWPWRYGGVG
jgi:hypothetical protein